MFHRFVAHSDQEHSLTVLWHTEIRRIQYM